MAERKSKTAPARPVRPPHPDIVAGVLFCVGLLLATAVLTYEPGDDSSLHPFGEPGFWIAKGLFEALGLTVYVLLAGWFIQSLILFARRDLARWLTRVVGWLLLLPCAAVAADQFRSFLDGPAVAGSGGAVGAGLSHALVMHLPLVGRAAVFAACLTLGLYLAADVVLRWLARRGHRVAHATGRIMRKAAGLTARFFAPAPVQREAVVLVKRALPQAEAGDADVRSVPISRSKAETIAVQEARDSYQLPPSTLLDDPDPFPHELHDSALRETAALLEKTFTDLGLNVRVVGIHTGPVITQYEVALETGLRVNKVTVLGDDLALNLRVPSVRIVAPIPGKNTVGIEVPNEHRAVVRLKELILSSAAKVAKSRLPLFLGKDTEGRPLVYDLAEMPHLLIAGRTGTGKSVCLNSIILSLLLTRRPDECRMIMIDPKQVEFSDYTRLPHLMCPVVTQNSKAEAILAWAVDKMEERYSLLARSRCRNIAQYNALPYGDILARVRPTNDDEQALVPEQMPYIVIIIDEIGDLMMEMKKEVESHIIRLAQKSRAAGIHLILATQRPTVDVITGLIKSNLPARICFQVSSRSDSRVVLDENGADKLLGKGDMLFLQPGTSTLIRAQGAYASDQEILRIVEHLECDPEFVPELLELKSRSHETDGDAGPVMKSRDPLYEQAVEVIVREGRGSVSLLQRALGIGYGKAARFIDYMAEDGVVGHYNGSQAREVLISPEQWEEMRHDGSSAERV